MEVPADSTEDVAGFQTHWLREDPETPVYEVLLCRQLTDRAEPIGRLTRLVALQFLYEGARQDLAETEVWSSDFRSVGKFLDHVEHLPEFEFALEGPLTQGDAILYDEDVPEAAA
jgi:hypothetical protein